jgi:hypothetical protein
MNTHRLIELDAFALIDGDSPMKYEIVVPTEARVVLGHGTGSFDLTVSQEGLIRLMELAGAALTDMRARAATRRSHPAR